MFSTLSLLYYYNYQLLILLLQLLCRVLLGNNVLLGMIRIGTLRLKSKEKCQIPQIFQTKVETSGLKCYSKPGTSQYDNDDYGAPMLLFKSKKVDSSSSSSSSSKDPGTTSAITTEYYLPSNFHVHLANVETKNHTVLNQIKQLQENHFIDLATRAETIDLNVYNPR